MIQLNDLEKVDFFDTFKRLRRCAGRCRERGSKKDVCRANREPNASSGNESAGEESGYGGQKGFARCEGGKTKRAGWGRAKTYTIYEVGDGHEDCRRRWRTMTRMEQTWVD